jgi:hypothetical protein
VQAQRKQAHLRHADQRQRVAEPPLVRTHVDHRLQQPQAVVERRFRVGDVVGDRQRQPRKVRLQQQVRLGVRVVAVGRVHGPADLATEREVELVLVVPHLHTPITLM